MEQSDHWQVRLTGVRREMFGFILEHTAYESVAGQEVRVLKMTPARVSRQFGLSTAYCHSTFVRAHPYIVPVGPMGDRSAFVVFERLSEAAAFHALLNKSSTRTNDPPEPIQKRDDHAVREIGPRVTLPLAEFPEPRLLFPEKGDIIGGPRHNRVAFPEIIGGSSRMIALKDVVEQFSRTDEAVFLRGETGTGKELFARVLHLLSRRRTKQFITVNCAAIPDTLLEAELFGVEQGAYTDAKKNRAGKFEEADGGTLFLDEVGDLSPAGQTKLLRVVESGVVERLGGGHLKVVDVRLITATNKGLERCIREGFFRLDLYHRLNVLAIAIPPLRDRGRDIAMIARFVIERLSVQYDVPALFVRKDFTDFLEAHEWPGNVRELVNILTRAVILSKNDIITMPPDVVPDHERIKVSEGNNVFDVREVEKRAILRALEETNGNRQAAARLLGMGVATLYRKFKDYNIKYKYP